jgi:hypothetical protein
MGPSGPLPGDLRCGQISRGWISSIADSLADTAGDGAATGPVHSPAMQGTN